MLVYLMSMSRSCLSYLRIRSCCNVVENVINTIEVVQSDVMFSGFLVFEKCSNLLSCAMLSTNQIECGVAIL